MDLTKIAAEFFKERSRTGKAVIDLVLLIIGMTVCGWASEHMGPAKEYVDMLFPLLVVIAFLLAFRVFIVAMSDLRDGEVSSAKESPNPTCESKGADASDSPIPARLTRSSTCNKRR